MHLVILESLLERREETGAHPGDTDTGGSHFWKLVLPQGHCCWPVPFWNPPSSLLALGLAPPTSLEAPVLGHLRPSS